MRNESSSRTALPRPSTRLVPALLVGLLVILLGACSSGNPGSSMADGSGVKTVVPVAKRTAPIELAGTTLEGKHLDLATLRGKPVVLNIWGSWCSTCRLEAPNLVSAAAELGDKAAFVGIDTRDDVAQGLAYQRRAKIGYPSLFDNGTMLLVLRGAYAAKSPPVTLVLDPQGRVAGRFVGVVSKLTLIDMVADVSKA